MKQIALLSMAVAMFIAFASCGYAVSVAYVVRNPASPNNDFVQALQENGFTVTLIDDNNAATTNFSKYSMILVGEETLVNPSAVPIQDYPSLVANTQHLSVWGYASTAGVVSVGNGFLKGKLMVNNSITSGLPAVVQLYTSYGINGYFLPKLPDRSRDIQNVVGTNNADLNPFIGTYKAGDRLYGGGYAKTRGCFYGLVNSRYWTADAKTLFIRCAKYVAYAFDKDGDGYIEAVDCDDSNAQVNPSMTEVLYNGLDDDCNPATLDDDLDLDGYKLANDCNDKNSAINPGVADIPYNNIDENCDGFDLADVDQDGYCKSGYIVKSRALQCPQETGTAGTDCNDNDATIHPKATEIPYDSIDQDCNGADLLDADGDGYCKSGYSIINKALRQGVRENRN
jgi:hypothetical protein